MRLLSFPADLDSVAVRQPDVEDGNIWAERRDTTDRLVRRPGFSYDFDLAIGLEQPPDTGTHHLVVIEKEHLEHYGNSLSGVSQLRTASHGSGGATPAGICASSEESNG